MLDYTHVLLAPLGTQAHVVTLALDQLLVCHYPISEVIVVHPKGTSPSSLQNALEALTREFQGGHYGQTGRSIHMRDVVLHSNDVALEEITDDFSMEGARETMDTLIRELKLSNHIIHLVSGDNHLMVLLSFTSVLIHFEPADHLWHLFIPEPIQERINNEHMMHVLPDAGVRLVEVPYARMAQPILTRLLNPLTAPSAHKEQFSQPEEEELLRCQSVLDRVTPRQRDILLLFAKGLTPQEVAESLGISLVTVNSHKTALLVLCRETWGMSPDRHLSYDYFRITFTRYVEDQGFRLLKQRGL